MNGRPLPPRHGFPLRLLVPGWYGVANVKWLTRLALRPARCHGVPPSAGPAMERQAGGRRVCAEPWVSRQRVKSVIARVTRGRDGRVTSRGVAWSDGTPVARVDVQVDGGAWQPALLETPASRFGWTCFSVRSDLGPGDHRVVSRASDCAGRTQPAHLDLRRTYWEDCAQFARTIKVPPRRA